MFEHNEKIQFIKDTLGTREKYHEIITNHSFTNFEKDILLQASVNIKSSNIDESLINVAYDILISKSIQNNTQEKNSTINLSLLKYLLLIGSLFVLFYITTLKEPAVVKKGGTSKQENVAPEHTSVVKFGDIRGQGFLRTQGGSIRTCAGNSVYIEESNPNGFLVLNEKLEKAKDKIIIAHLTNVNIAATSVENIRSIFNYEISETSLSLAKKNHSEAMKRISEQKIYILSLEKELPNLEEKVNNSIKDNILKTMCDAQGNFEFPKVEVGKYYISTVIQWYVGDEKQGGIVSKTITIKEGKNKIMITE